MTTDQDTIDQDTTDQSKTPDTGTTGTTGNTARAGLLIHAAGHLDQDAVQAVLRSATNARTALPPGTAIEVIIQGTGVAMLTAGSPAAESLNQAQDLEIGILACGNSMRSAGLPTENLISGIAAVPAAVAHLTQRQWAGWAYVRPSSTP